MNKKKKHIQTIQKLNKIMTEPRLLSMKELEKEKITILKQNEELYNLTVANDNKEIRIIYNISGYEIILKQKINIITETLSDLHDKIHRETNKVNISSIIINQYLYTDGPYTQNYWPSLVDLAINRDFPVEPIIPHIMCSYYIVSTLLDKNYNKDYIEVSLIFGSYTHYIQKIVINWIYNDEYDYNHDLQIFFGEYYLDDINNIDFLHYLGKLNNDHISLDDYNEIELFTIKSFKQKRYSNNNKRLLHQNYLLNLIKKFTID